MANKQPSELTEPCVGAFDDPAAFVAPRLPAVPVFSFLVAFPVRNDEVNASLAKPLAERVGVVGAVGDHAFRLLSRPAFGTRDVDFGERGFRKRNFSWRGTFKPNSQRKTATVDQYHPLRPLAALGFSDCGAPFLLERSCRPGTSLPTAAALRRPARPAALAARRAIRPAPPTASTAASRWLETDTCRARTSTPLRSVAPTEFPPNKLGWKSTDDRACPCAASVQAAAEQSTPPAHRPTPRIASCSCKKTINLPTSCESR